MNPDANRAPYPTRIRPLVLLAVLTAMSVAWLPTVAAPDAGSRSQPSTPDELISAAEQALEQGDLYGAAQALTAAADASPEVGVAERATQVTFGAGFDALAEQAARRWAVLAPQNPLPREVLGRLKLRRYAVDDAVPDFLAALGPGEPRRDEVYLALASDLASEPDATEVTRLLSRLTALDPLAPGLQLALGTAALRSGDDELALGAGAIAAEDDPGWSEPRLLIARAQAALGRADEALATAAALTAASPVPPVPPVAQPDKKPDPGLDLDLGREAGSDSDSGSDSDPDAEPGTAGSTNPLVDLEYARLLADAGHVAEAREKLAALAAQYGNRPEITRTLAFLDLASGDLEAADQRLEALEDTGPDRLEAFYFRAQIAAQRGDAPAARRFYERISSGPYLVPAQLGMAESLARSGAAEEAVAQLTQFEQDHPAQAFEVLEFKAQLFKLLNRPDDALAVYGEALRYKPASVSVLLARGALLEQLGKVDAAVKDLRTAAELAPADAIAANAYGYLLASRTNQTLTAWRYVRRAYEIQPGSAAIQDSVGWTLFKLGRTKEARSHLEEALDRMPDPEIASHLATVLWKLGDRGEATELLRSAIVAYPDSQPVRETAERLLD